MNLSWSWACLRIHRKNNIRTFIHCKKFLFAMLWQYIYSEGCSPKQNWLVVHNAMKTYMHSVAWNEMTDWPSLSIGLTSIQIFHVIFSVYFPVFVDWDISLCFLQWVNCMLSLFYPFLIISTTFPLYISVESQVCKFVYFFYFIIILVFSLIFFRIFA